jgi:hypothetical protein
MTNQSLFAIPGLTTGSRKRRDADDLNSLLSRQKREVADTNCSGCNVVGTDVSAWGCNPAYLNTMNAACAGSIGIEMEYTQCMIDMAVLCNTDTIAADTQTVAAMEEQAQAART